MKHTSPENVLGFVACWVFHTYMSSTKREGLGKLREKKRRCHTRVNRVMPQATFRTLDNLWHLMTEKVPCLSHGNYVRQKG